MFKAKRPAMATIAAGYSDQVIFTSDNPRTEDPEVVAGVSPGILLHGRETGRMEGRQCARSK